ncbi:MAG TPA: CBS domain-containing protein [Methylomirabilota bacterium]|nr:CBS domain-containing protein [Methylomirabilota bacterium]
MAVEVPVVSPETPLHTAARLLLTEGLAALPVVDAMGRVVGVLSEHDLTARVAPRQGRPWWHLLVDAEQLAAEYRKATGRTVEEVMTHPTPTVSPGTPLVTAFRRFDDPAVDLVPVVLAGRLVGTLGRRHLVEHLSTVPASATRRSDAELVAEMQNRMAREAWVSKPYPAVEACGGVVTLWGLVGGGAEKAALATVARSIPDCKGITDRMITRDVIYRYHEAI